MSEILFVTKPMAPPWTDGTKTLVRDLARHMTRHEPVVLGVRGLPFDLARGRMEPLFSPSSVTVGSASAMRLAARLASGRRGDVWHFVFAPTGRTMRTSRALARFRGVPTVQTIPSLPAAPRESLASLAFADRVVVLSRSTERAFLDAGTPPSRLRRIAPCVEAVRWSAALASRGRTVHALPAGAPIVVFPGDLEPNRGAREILEGFARLRRGLGAILVVAARRKTPRSADTERALRARAADLGIAGAVRWVGETPHMHALLAAADAVALPARDLGAKVDLPIVLLEAMSLGRAVLVAQGTSAAELAEGGAAATCASDAIGIGVALEQILDDSARRSELGRRAALADYGPARMSATYEALYDELVR